MYSHPSNHDPYAERQPLTAYVPPPADRRAPDPSCLILALIVSLPASVLFFALGYMSGVWGWVA